MSTSPLPPVSVDSRRLAMDARWFFRGFAIAGIFWGIVFVIWTHVQDHDAELSPDAHEEGPRERVAVSQLGQ